MYDNYEDFDELGAESGVTLVQDWEDDLSTAAIDAPWMTHIGEGGMDDVEDRLQRLMLAAGFGAVALEHGD